MEHDERNFYNGLMGLVPLCDAVKQQIIENRAIRDWGPVKKSFSALTLLDHNIMFPVEIREVIRNYLEREVSNVELRNILSRIGNDANDLDNTFVISQWISQHAGVTDEWRIRITFVLYLIVLEEKLRYVSELMPSIELETNTGRKLAGFLRNNFHELQKWLPASPVGNIFGFVYDKDEKILTAFRQFAFGRALVTSLPYLLLDKKGRPQGPHVLLLSGTSWAKGSHKYHVWVPVKYILEAEAGVRDKISQSKVVLIPAEARVSGSRHWTRVRALREVVQTAKGIFAVNYSRSRKAKFYL